MTKTRYFCAADIIKRAQTGGEFKMIAELGHAFQKNARPLAGQPEQNKIKVYLSLLLLKSARTTRGITIHWLLTERLPAHHSKIL